MSASLSDAIALEWLAFSLSRHVSAWWPRSLVVNGSWFVAWTWRDDSGTPSVVAVLRDGNKRRESVKRDADTVDVRAAVARLLGGDHA